jgi:hypothetical protein
VALLNGAAVASDAAPRIARVKVFILILEDFEILILVIINAVFVSLVWCENSEEEEDKGNMYAFFVDIATAKVLLKNKEAATIVSDKFGYSRFVVSRQRLCLQ